MLLLRFFRHSNPALSRSRSTYLPLRLPRPATSLVFPAPRLPSLCSLLPLQLLDSNWFSIKPFDNFTTVSVFRACSAGSLQSLHVSLTVRTGQDVPRKHWVRSRHSPSCPVQSGHPSGSTQPAHPGISHEQSSHGSSCLGVSMPDLCPDYVCLGRCFSCHSQTYTYFNCTPPTQSRSTVKRRNAEGFFSSATRYFTSVRFPGRQR